MPHACPVPALADKQRMCAESFAPVVIFLLQEPSMDHCTIYLDKTAAEHQAMLREFSHQGYRLLSLSVYGTPPDALSAAVWLKQEGPPGSPGMVRRWLAISSFSGLACKMIVASANTNPQALLALLGIEFMLNGAVPPNDPLFGHRLSLLTDGPGLPGQHTEGEAKLILRGCYLKY